MVKYLVFCIGNPEGGDDAVGPYIAKKLKNFESDDLTTIDAGAYPENYTGTIKEIKPEQLIIVDAIDMNLEPGEIRFVPPEKIGEMHISTHGIPLSVLIRYLKQKIEEIMLIGIQPSKMSGEITDVAKKNAGKLVELIKNKKLNQIETL